MNWREAFGWLSTLWDLGDRGESSDMIVQKMFQECKRLLRYAWIKLIHSRKGLLSQMSLSTFWWNLYPHHNNIMAIATCHLAHSPQLGSSSVSNGRNQPFTNPWLVPLPSLAVSDGGWKYSNRNTGGHDRGWVIFLWVADGAPKSKEQTWVWVSPFFVENRFLGFLYRPSKRMFQNIFHKKASRQWDDTPQNNRHVFHLS